MTIGIGQIVSGISTFFDPWGLLIIPANILAGSVIMLRLMTCAGLDLPMDKRRWEGILVILAFGFVWNLISPFVAHSWLLWR